jgi:membrane-bound lytic murein transglycosylase C
MDRRHFLLSLLAAPLAAQAQSFEEFRRQQREGVAGRQQAFDAYEERVRAAFEAYREAHRQAFEDYKARIARHWDEPRLPSQTEWVEYRDDLAVRRVVDYANGRLGIEITHRPGEPVRERLRDHLRGLLDETPAEAHAQDPVAGAVERAVRAGGAPAESGEPDRTRLLSGLFDAPPSRAAVRRKAGELFERGKVESAPVRRAEQARGQERTVLSIDLPADQPLKDYRDYLATVRRQAGEWGVPPALALAVIHTESSFNPMAKSHIPAYGMMQIVPESAGRDASREIFGRSRVLSPSYLYNADNNINVGCCYLSILDGRYLSAVRDDESRLYCVIAAYNTGAGNVARAFTGGTSVSAAAEVINDRSPADVYRALRRDLPYAEARHYLRRVAKRLRTYREVV